MKSTAIVTMILSLLDELEMVCVIRLRQWWLSAYACSAVSRTLITFRVRVSRNEMYNGHGRLCVCLSLCPSPHSHTTAPTRM